MNIQDSAASFIVSVFCLIALPCAPLDGQRVWKNEICTLKFFGNHLKWCESNITNAIHMGIPACSPGRIIYLSL